MDKKIRFFLMIMLALVLAGCTTMQKNKPVLVEHPERIFWELKTDTAKVYILGTIHIADKSFYPLEAKVMNAFNTADYLVSEMGGKEMIHAAQQYMSKKAIKSMVLPDSEKSLSRFLSKEEMSCLGQWLDDEMRQTFLQCAPWVMQYGVLANLIQYSHLSVQDGIDLYLVKHAKNKSIDALDAITTQFELLSSGSFDEQLQMLHHMIADRKSGRAEKQLYAMISAYKANNKKELEKIVFDMNKYPSSFSEIQKKGMVNCMFRNRNKKWAKKVRKYLKRGGTTFIFAGAGHFLGDENVFEQLGLSE